MMNAVMVLVRVQDRFRAALVACLTNVMRRLALCHLWLQRQDKNSRRQSLQLVALSLSFPCFELHNLCFKVAYLLNQRRALLINRENARLGIHEGRIEFDELGLKGLSVPQAYHRLRHILQESERRDRSADCGHIRHRLSLLERELALRAIGGESARV